MKETQGITCKVKNRTKIKLWIFMLLSTFVMLYLTYYSYNFYKDFFKTRYDYLFQDPTLPIDIRLDNLMSLLTQREKVL